MVRRRHLENVGLVLVLDDIHGVGAHVHDGFLHLGVAECHRQLRIRHDLLQHLNIKAPTSVNSSLSLQEAESKLD